MIAAKETDREVVGGFSGVTHAMKINDEAMALVMDQLARGLYSKPKAAIVREYSTNARDAHVQAGCPDRPIEVYLPTSLKPLLAIRDYGTGLTEAEIGEIYSQYGASTKRESNEFNGMLGFGCKSAFAYSNQFTVTSVKDGNRIQVAVTRNEDGGGEMTVADQCATDEPNGTLIQIPTSPGDNFEAEVQEFYYWWPEGSVKAFHGGTMGLPMQLKHFDPAAEGNMDLGDGIYIVAHERARYSPDRHGDVVLMGGVAYPHSFVSGLDNYSHSLVVYAPMGAVSFQSSREALRLDAQTKKFLHDTEAKFKRALVATMQAKINAAPTRYAAAKVVADWKSIIPANVVPTTGWQYNGAAIPLNVTVDGSPDAPNILRTAPLRRNGHHNYHRKHHKGLSINEFIDTLWVEGYTAEKFTASHAQKLRKYAVDNKIDTEITNGFVLVGAIPDELKPWLQRVVTWETIKAVKLPRDTPARVAAGMSGRIPGSYDLFTTRLGTQVERQEGVAAEKFRHWSEPLYYVNQATWKASYTWSALKAITPKATLVCMPAGRIDKFCRDFPAAKEATKAIRDGYDAWAAQPTVKDSLLALAIQKDYWTRYLKDYDENLLDDPELKRYTRLCKQDTQQIAEQNRVFMSVLGRGLSLPDVDDPKARYPLMERDSHAHTYFYCNAVYAARQNGENI